ncbi:MAG: hypothetical protein DHS20C05_11900 [Hyphococcus sp.]|nr:MAG: hypothetical protein DHS20C05_11900 [Marinicaulis sp.]
MPKYLYVYHGGKNPETPEEGEAVMAKWMSWLGGLGGDVVDPGNPVGVSTTVYADKVEGNGGSNPASGYGLVNAKDMDDAVAKAKGCPVLESGGSVEVAETFEI